jgi:hypothetical protein
MVLNSLCVAIIAEKDSRDKRIAVQNQPGQYSSRDPILKIPNTKKGW